MNEQLAIECKPRDNRGQHLVIATLGPLSHRHKFDCDNQRDRRAFREAVVSKFGLSEDAHDFIEARITATAELADNEPLVRPEIVRLSDVQPESVEWLWPGRIAIGKLTLIAGNPGLGKSLVTLDIAARITRGAAWPDNQWEPQTAGGVVLLSAEDDLGDTIRPRLDSHLADVSKIVALQSIGGADAEGDYKRAVDLARDTEHLRAAIKTVDNCRLVVVDPISAYLGKTDSHKNAEVRAVLAPLAELAADTRVAVLCVSHLRKGEGQAIYRTMGSLAFVAAARAAWIVTEDNANPRRRLLLPAKNNLAPDTEGLAFAVESLGVDGAPVVTWEPGAVTISADDAMDGGRKKHGPAPDEREEAAEWLQSELASGARPAKELLDDGKGMGFTERTLQRAFRSINGQREKRGFSGGWLWSVSQGDTNTTSNPRHSQPVAFDATCRLRTNPEDDAFPKTTNSCLSTKTPSSESVWIDEFEAERLECNGHADVPF